MQLGLGWSRGASRSSHSYYCINVKYTRYGVSSRKERGDDNLYVAIAPIRRQSCIAYALAPSSGLKRQGLWTARPR